MREIKLGQPDRVARIKLTVSILIVTFACIVMIAFLAAP